MAKLLPPKTSKALK